MQMNATQDNWPNILDKLCTDFPELDRSRLPSNACSILEIAANLSGTHDLTMAEAQETLLDWQFLNISTYQMDLAA